MYKRSIKSLNYEILIVDDCSTDNTVNVVKKFKKSNQLMEIILIVRDENKKGLGYNYFDSIKIARGNYYMLINGDNVEPVDAIKTILSAYNEADMIIPNFGSGDKRSKNRKLISLIFTTLINFIMEIVSNTIMVLFYIKKKTY